MASKSLDVLESIKKSLTIDGRLSLIDSVRCEIIEKELKALELIKGINFDIVYREQLDEWTLFIVTESQDGEPLEPVTFGSGKEQYELLKEVLL